MKVGMRADDLRLVLQHDTALDLCGLEIVEGMEQHSCYHSFSRGMKLAARIRRPIRWL
jgi:hypothetical protein